MAIYSNLQNTSPNSVYLATGKEISCFLKNKGDRFIGLHGGICHFCMDKCC